MKTKNLLFLFLIALLLVAAYLYFFIYNKSHVDTFTAKADYKIEAVELFRYFEEDEVKANEKFLGNILRVEGVVLEVEYSEGEITAIRLDVGELLDAVVCEPDPIYKREIPAINAGDWLAVQGVCTGFLDDVIINRCVVLEVKK